MPKILLKVVCNCIAYDKTARPSMEMVRKAIEELVEQFHMDPGNIEYVSNPRGMEEVQKVLQSNPQHHEAATSSSEFGSLSIW
jgi:hypothetical protein